MKEIYLPRTLSDRVERHLGQFPVVVVAGARQTGKTTLVGRLPSARERTYRTLDDPETLELAERDPNVLLEEAPRLTLDEVQRVPALLLAVKRRVDQKRIPGQFLLTGSANLLLMHRVSESLAGRAVYLFLRPLTESEKRGRPAMGPWERLLEAGTPRDAAEAVGGDASTPFDWPRAVLEGGFPAAVLEKEPERRTAWFEGYVRTYVERDVRQLSQVNALVDFRRLMKAAAFRAGRLANQAEMARDAGLSHATAHRYLNLLETSFLVSFVPTYSVSRTKRLAKMPKLYWGDTGLAAHLAGIETEADLRRYDGAGGLLENLVWHHLQCWADQTDRRAEILSWRTASGEEVDFVLERGDRLLPVEVKSSGQVLPEDARHLRSFLEEYRRQTPFGIVLYGGTRTRAIADRILAVPLAKVLASA